jgi:hypothetical protein
MMSREPKSNEVIIVETRRRPRDDEPTVPDDITLRLIEDDAAEEGDECGRAST